MTVDKKDLITVRGPRPADIPFIFSTWLRGLRYGSEFFKAIDNEVYYAVYHKAVENLLARGVVRIACLKEDEDVILGYSVCTGARLDWVHVKDSWRGIGIAKSLVPEGIQAVSHLTKVGAEILKKHPTIKFIPFL